MTIKLYDADSHLFAFDATVLSCAPAENGYAVVLNQTAFFPEGGGQCADTGSLGGARVRDVQITDDEIVHLTDAPLTPGGTVRGEVDREARFRLMQHHSGEHIVSGLIHTLFGFENVGFHLARDDMTMDYSGELTREQLDRVEQLANEAVCRDLPVSAVYPAAEELAALSYRSKKVLTGAVRIVTIPGYDCCACCAPHVRSTGEIGVIKLLDFIRYKGGIRVHAICGFRALEDYRTKYAQVSAIAQSLSAKQEEAAAAVRRLSEENERLKQQLAGLKKQAVAAKLRQLTPVSGNRCFFETDADAALLRQLVNGALPATGGICAAFAGDDEAGYRYVMGGRAMREAGKAFHTALSGKGGGSDTMIQGSVPAARADICAYFGVDDAD